MKLPRRKFLHLAAGAAALAAVSRFAWAQAYPTRPVRIIVPLSRRPSILHHRTSHWSIAVGAARAEPSPFLQDLEWSPWPEFGSDLGNPRELSKG